MTKSSSGADNDQPVPGPDVRVQHRLVTCDYACHRQVEYAVLFGLTYLVRSHARTQDRSNDFGIHILRQDGQIVRVKDDVLLKAPIFMMQMVRAPDAVLLGTGETKLAPSADAARESDAHKISNFDVWLATRSESDDASDALMATDVREFDLGDGIAVRASCSSIFGVKIYDRGIQQLRPLFNNV